MFYCYGWWVYIPRRPLINIIVTSSAGSFFLGAVDCSVKRKDASFQLEILQQEIGGCVTTSGAGIDRGRSCLDHVPCACTQQCIAGYWED